MVTALRFIGLINAGIWLGTVVYQALVVEPVFGSREMTRLLTDPYAIGASLLVGKQFYLMNILCGFIAMFYLLTEWLYLGRALDRAVIWTVIGLTCLAILWGSLIQPRRERLHTIQFTGATERQREFAGKSFRFWTGVGGLLNFVFIGGVGFFFWQISQWPGPSRSSFRLHKLKG